VSYLGSCWYKYFTFIYKIRHWLKAKSQSECYLLTLCLATTPLDWGEWPFQTSFRLYPRRLIGRRAPTRTPVMHTIARHLVFLRLLSCTGWLMTSVLWRCLSNRPVHVEALSKRTPPPLPQNRSQTSEGQVKLSLESNLKSHYRVHNSPVLSQINTIHFFPPYVPEIHSHITLPPTPKSSKWSLPSDFPTKLLCVLLISPMRATWPPISPSLIWSP